VIVTRKGFGFSWNVTGSNFGTKSFEPVFIVGASLGSYTIFKSPSDRPEGLYGIRRY